MSYHILKATYIKLIVMHSWLPSPNLAITADLVQQRAAHVFSATTGATGEFASLVPKPLPVSAWNIEKLGVAWGRSYGFTTYVIKLCHTPFLNLPPPLKYLQSSMQLAVLQVHTSQKPKGILLFPRLSLPPSVLCECLGTQGCVTTSK